MKSSTKTKHAIVGLFSVGLFICLIGFIGTVIYFNHLTHESSKISDRELKQKVLHFAGDDLINHENSDVLSEYDKSENSLIVVLNTSIQMLLKPLPLPRIPCFINIKVSFKSTRTSNDTRCI